MACAVELRCGGKPGRSGADYRHLLSGSFGGRLGDDPTFLESLIDDRTFDALDRDRRLVDAEHARAFAWGRAHPAGKFREVVGLMKALQRLAPQTAIDQVGPLGDQIV